MLSLYRRAFAPFIRLHGRYAMLNSPTGPRSDSADRPSGSMPSQEARGLYSLLASSVRRFFKIRPGTTAISEQAPVRPEESATDETAARVGPALHSQPEDRSRPDDAQVREWKAAWVEGADGRWAGALLLANPHKPGSPRAAAWRAGWHWAERQPDRREPSAVRFAHPHRRRADHSSRLVRSAQAGAVGLSMVSIAVWLWQIRRQRTRKEQKSGVVD
jgi:hypothetical protein